MYKELERAIGELRVNHTDKEITGALSECFQIVKNVSYDYTDNATAKDIREDHPELGFMDDGEIVEILEQAREERGAGMQIMIMNMKKNKKFQKEQLARQGYEEIVEIW